jgi:hypothetical protein
MCCAGLLSSPWTAAAVVVAVAVGVVVATRWGDG